MVLVIILNEEDIHIFKQNKKRKNNIKQIQILIPSIKQVQKIKISNHIFTIYNYSFYSF